ncbi:MAG: lipoyl(octanoyl) transferase LipB [Spirochaetota bacterium]|nr:lipoyl(octanoyl) transferase LipB [Spirochaetota bacterium]
MKLTILNKGLMDYGEALELQKDLLAKRQNEEINDTLILLEHPPVITKGKRTEDHHIVLSDDLLQSQGIGLYEIDRGGEATYHGPGQLVGYLIFHLYKKQRELKKFIASIEEVFIQLLKKEYGITADRDLKHRGVWVGDEKITAIGISIHKAVTMHGFAFNINTNLDHFKWIIPCGITDKGVSSIKKITDITQDMEKIKQLTGKYFAEIFNYKEVEIINE